MNTKTFLTTIALSLTVAATPAAAMTEAGPLVSERPAAQVALSHDAVQPRDYQNRPAPSFHDAQTPRTSPVTPAAPTTHDAVQRRDYQSQPTSSFHDAQQPRDYQSAPTQSFHDAQMPREIVDVPAPAASPSDGTDVLPLIFGGLLVLLSVPMAVIGLRRIRPTASRV